MLTQPDPSLVIALFGGGLAIVVGLGLAVIALVLKERTRHRNRLARVGRGRIFGRVDLEEMRLKLQKPKQDASLLIQVTDLFSRFFPLLNTTRLIANFERAGMEITIGRFAAYSVALGVVFTGLGAGLMGYSLPITAVVSLLLAMFISDTVVKMRGDRMAAKFMRQLPDALETIIRGIRSGLPVIECIATVGKEFEDPIGMYFEGVAERVKLGQSLDVSLWNVARIIRRPEMDFLSICISIQIETGGSLAEALSGLADLLRKRQQMRQKVRAISSEAKASALIIGALPFMMLGILSIMAPDYIGPLFTDPRGHIMLGLGGLSIAIGAFVMWRMTQFEI
ncbi:type II secretion system F family protein [Rhodobacteraceae bacterium DSL-40]|uniref:type II secretion system F family protein n=1 Tax=Amaricoccus sp. B4 TaxID=3368557 RepID=UPI0013A70BE9